MNDNETVRVLSDEDLRDAVGTPGLHRRVAAEDAGYWFGHVKADADTFSGWHHHGEMVTLGYVLSGTVRFEFGPGGHDTVEVGAGQYFVVPPHAIHREGNLTDEEAEVILARFGDGDPVFPVDGPDAESPASD